MLKYKHASAFSMVFHMMWFIPSNCHILSHYQTITMDIVKRLNTCSATDSEFVARVDKIKARIFGQEV